MGQPGTAYPFKSAMRVPYGIPTGGHFRGLEDGALSFFGCRLTSRETRLVNCASLVRSTSPHPTTAATLPA